MNTKIQAYEQNYEQFRSLNQIMWQIPVLAMTLTGGLWFGVSSIQDSGIDKQINGPAVLALSAGLAAAKLAREIALVCQRFQ